MSQFIYGKKYIISLLFCFWIAFLGLCFFSASIYLDENPSNNKQAVDFLKGTPSGLILKKSKAKYIFELAAFLPPLFILINFLVRRKEPRICCYVHDSAFCDIISPPLYKLFTNYRI